MTDPDRAEPEVSPSVALGAAFGVARDRAGMTRDEVADVLHLDVAVVAAIEEGRFEDLPMRPYARGYVRNYARILGLDADDLARRFDAADVGRPEPSGVGLRPRVSRKAELALRPLALGYAAIVAILLIALGAVLWTAWRVQDWQFPFLADDPVAPPTEPDTTQQPVTESPASPPNVSPWPSVADSTVDDAVADESLTSESADEPFAPPTVAVAADPGSSDDGDDALGLADDENAEVALAGRSVDGAAAGTGILGELTVVFDDESWVSVDDATGRQIFGDLGRSGRTVTVAGPVPLSLLVGNALAVRVEFDGESVDLEPFTSDQNVARLELGGG